MGKKHIILLGMLVICFMSGGCNHPDRYEITGKITGASGHKVWLKYLFKGETIIDSTIADSDQFELTGTLNEPDRYFIFIQGFDYPVSLLLENASFRIYGKADSLWLARVVGGKENDLQLQLDKKLEPTIREGDSLYYLLLNAQDRKDETAYNRLKPMVDKYDSELGQLTEEFVRLHPDALASLLALCRNNSIERFGIEKTDSLLKSLSPRLQNHSMGKDLRARLEDRRHAQVRGITPRFSEPDPAHVFF